MSRYEKKMKDKLDDEIKLAGLQAAADTGFKGGEGFGFGEVVTPKPQTSLRFGRG